MYTVTSRGNCKPCCKFFIRYIFFKVKNIKELPFEVHLGTTNKKQEPYCSNGILEKKIQGSSVKKFWNDFLETPYSLSNDLTPMIVA